MAFEKYYRHKDSKEEFVLSQKIKDGIVVTTFNEEGCPYANWEDHIFISNENLYKEWEEFKFLPPIKKGAKTDHLQRLFLKFFRDLNFQLRNHGLLEDAYGDRNCIDSECNMLRTILFESEFDNKNFEAVFSSVLKSHFTEETADDFLLSDNVCSYFSMIHALKLDVVNIINCLSEESQTEQPRSPDETASA